MHNLTTFDWSDLRYFLAVARKGSSLAAARALRVNQSTVHRRLVELEKRLGCPLVERRPSGYRLTEYGKELQPYAERVEQAASALRRHAATFDKGMRGTVRLTCSTTIAYRLMRAELLDNFHKRYPGIKIELLMTDRVLDLSNGEADVGIRGGEAREEALVGKKIADVPWAVYAIGHISSATAGREALKTSTTTASSSSSARLPLSRRRAGCRRRLHRLASQAKRATFRACCSP
jgi:DNA-binding transcriptional LysR family regulator